MSRTKQTNEDEDGASHEPGMTEDDSGRAAI